MLRRVLLALALAFSASPVFAANDLLVIVDLQLQTMHVRVDGETKYRWDVSSGRKGYATPPGRYQPTRMYRKYFSRTYDNAPMPFSIFFHEGYAIHGTGDLRNLGRVASHGCVRLDPAHAERLFDLVKQVGVENTVIRVESSRANTARIGDPMLPPDLPDMRQIEAATADLEVDPLATGSTGKPAWLRGGLDG